MHNIHTEDRIGGYTTYPADVLFYQHQILLDVVNELTDNLRTPTPALGRCQLV